MPNWCSTSYEISGDAAVAMVATLEERKAQNVSNWNWLGHFVTDFGGDVNNVYSRGWIDDYDYNAEDRCLNLYCETAWSECNEWRAFIKSKFKDTTIYYVAEEPGMGIFETNNPNFEFWYQCENDGENYEFKTEKELLKKVCEIIGCEVPICKDDEMLSVANSLAMDYTDAHVDEDKYIYIHKFEYCED